MAKRFAGSDDSALRTGAVMDTPFLSREEGSVRIAYFGSAEPGAQEREARRQDENHGEFVDEHGPVLPMCRRKGNSVRYAGLLSPLDLALRRGYSEGREVPEVSGRNWLHGIAVRRRQGCRPSPCQECMTVGVELQP